MILLAHILSGMKDYSSELEEAVRNKDAERLAEIKKEIIKLCNEIDRTI